MVSTPGLGYNSWQQNIYANGMSHANLYTNYNNGVGKVTMRVKSTLPAQQATTQLQAKEFNNMYMTPILQHLGQSGVIKLPIAFNYVYPDMSPTYSALTNWEGMQLPGGGAGAMRPLPEQGYGQQDPYSMYQNPQYSGFPQQGYPQTSPYGQYQQPQSAYSNPYAQYQQPQSAYGNPYGQYAQPNYGMQAPQASPYGYAPGYFG